jgi:hypothetical protein
MRRVLPLLICIAAFVFWEVFLLQGLSPRKAAAASIGVVGGPISIMAAICNWDWWFLHSATSGAVNRFGRTGARVLYVVLGTAVIAAAVFISGQRPQ